MQNTSFELDSGKNIRTRLFSPLSGLGVFKGRSYNSARAPPVQFRNNPSCRPFVDYVRKTLLDRIHSGAVSLLGRVGRVTPPHLVLSLTVEPSKPRLRHDTRFLNLWIVVVPFKLESLVHLPLYVGQVSNQTILDDKSEYDHCCCLRKVELILGYSGVVGISSTTHSPLVGRSHLYLSFNWSCGNQFLSFTRPSMLVIY